MRPWRGSGGRCRSVISNNKRGHRLAYRLNRAMVKNQVQIRPPWLLLNPMKKIPRFGSNLEAIQGQPRLTSDQFWKQVEDHLGVSFSNRKLSKNGRDETPAASTAKTSRGARKVRALSTK